jgi:(S)-beta-tyrosine adenylation enzyme
MTASCTFAPSTSRAVTSSAQEELWFLDRLMPNSAAFNLCRVYRVTGRLDIGAMRAAWHATVARHDILRTSLAEVDGRPVPREACERGGSAAFIDLSGERPAAGGPADRGPADRLCAELAAAPFSLATGPLARLTIVRVSSSQHRVVLTAHRAVADDGSVAILVGQLSQHYAALVDPGAPAPAPPAQSQFADYARQQRAWLGTPGFEDLLAWWTSRLMPSAPALTLPFDRRPGLSFQGTGLRFAWDEGAAAAVRVLAGRPGSAPFAVLLAAFQALLHRYGGGDRIAVGVPVTVRPPAFAGVVGPFGNLLVLCGDMSGSPTFGELLRRVSATAHEAFERRALPFGYLVRALGTDRDPCRIPWCDAMLVAPDVLGGGPAGELRIAGAVAESLPLEPGPTLADLTLTVEHIGPGIQGSLAYRGDPADCLAGAGMLGQLRTLIMAAADDPGTRVRDLPLDDSPRRRAAAGHTEPAAAAASAEAIAAAVPGAPVHELIRLRARQLPGATAVAWAGGAMSYRAMAAEAALIARYLRGLGSGQAVVVRMAPGARQVAASIGVLQAGARLLWFGAGDAGERGRMILTELRPACLLVDGEADTDLLARWYRDELGGRVVSVASLTRQADGAPPATLASPTTSAPQATLAPPVGLAEIAYVAYTSGSTGRPKGIAQSHGAFAQFTTWMAAEFGLRHGSRVAQWVAPEHDPSLCEVFASLVAGATLCPVPQRVRLHPERLADWLADERITFFQTVPSLARELLKVIASRGEPRRLAALDQLIVMGEAFPAGLANGLRTALPWVRLANIYGPTETIAAAWHAVTGPVGDCVPIGQPIPGRHLLVLDDEDRPCPTAVTGQIVIRSPYVAAGYLGGGGRDAFRPVAGPGTDIGCYRTGDLGRWRWDGLLEFRGRRDLQVKLGGTRIEITDVEAALASHDSVRECAVVPLAGDDGLVTHLVAYVVPRRTPAGEPAGGPAAWRTHLRGQFGAEMRLVLFHPMSHSLPRNLSGKVDRRRLPDPGGLCTGAAGAPRTAAERRMAEIWSELLGGEPASTEESFFAAGGHSLLLPQLVNRVQERFGVTITIAGCITHSSLAAMSALVTAAGAAAEPDAPPDPAAAKAAVKLNDGMRG